MANDSLASLDIATASRLLRSRKLSPVELTEGCLNRIERLNPALNAFITVTAESARAEAKQAEARLKKGRWLGPLHGVPIALKDLIDMAGGGPAPRGGALQGTHDRARAARSRTAYRHRMPPSCAGSRRPARSCSASSTCTSAPSAVRQ